MKKRIIQGLPFLSAAFCMLLIFLFSAQEGETSSALSGGVGEFVLKVLFPDLEAAEILEKEKWLEVLHYIIRKAAHFTIYFILGLSLLFGFYINKKKERFGLFFSLGISFLYALSDEIHQVRLVGVVSFRCNIRFCRIVYGNNNCVCHIYCIKEKNEK
jgi:VanZ family protein